MARRVPGVRKLMEQAALDLFESQGLAATTADQIAASAGVTERTFFRHFGDKVEAAFGDESRLQAAVGQAISVLPADQSAWSCVRVGLSVLADDFDLQGTTVRRRARVVAANPELEERELSRSAAWITVLVTALRARGVSSREAETAAAVGLTLFRLALGRWVADPATTFAGQLGLAWQDLGLLQD